MRRCLSGCGEREADTSTVESSGVGALLCGRALLNFSIEKEGSLRVVVLGQMQARGKYSNLQDKQRTRKNHFPDMTSVGGRRKKCLHQGIQRELKGQSGG